MRIAFISDIHGNLTALQAVLADLAHQNADLVISLGDVVTLGPQPAEVLATLRDLGCICISGNHDEAVLDPERAAELQIAAHLVPDLFWGQSRLSATDLEFIKSFHTTHELTFPDGTSVLCFHGSPHSSTDLILSTTPNEELDRFLNGRNADVFIGGHSHIQMLRRYGDKLVLNSGSVGNAFTRAYQPGIPPKLLPWAEYAVLDQNGQALEVELRRVPFNTAEVLSRVKECGLPGAEWWLSQY
ncbi:MAG: metallophosphoesterase family protein [Chloroflexi bacterium]|nr:metallophosphoesterase family protein [Chloroflexota bacterium]